MWTKRLYELDPRHKPLLEDHWSGYMWLQSTHPHLRYRPIERRGKSVMFTKDLGESIKQGAVKKAWDRRMAGGVCRDFKKIGYVYSHVNFVKVLPCRESSDQLRVEAVEVIKGMIVKMKEEVKLARYQKRFGSDYQIKPRYVVKDPGSRAAQTIWVWAFENKGLGLSFPFIYSYRRMWMEEVERDATHAEQRRCNEQERIARLKIRHRTNYRARHYKERVMRYKPCAEWRGLARHEFADMYNLTYSTLAVLAKGGIKQHKGWTLIGEPRRVSKEEARSIVDELYEKEEV